MKMLNEQVREQLKGLLNKMDKKVVIAVFTKENPCETCEETKLFMEELEEIGEKITLKKYHLYNDEEMAKKYEVTLTPSIVILDENENYKGIKFNGIQAGHEINSFLSTIMAVSGSGNNLPEEVNSKLQSIKKPVDIKVFVTLGCPHCPGAVEKANLIALQNSNIKSQMIEAQTFPELSDKFNVSSVPKVVINDKYEFVGNQPIEMFLQEIEKTQ